MYFTMLINNAILCKIIRKTWEKITNILKWSLIFLFLNLNLARLKIDPAQLNEVRLIAGQTNPFFFYWWVRPDLTIEAVKPANINGIFSFACLKNSACKWLRRFRRRKKRGKLSWLEEKREVGGVPKHPRPIFDRGHGSTSIIWIYICVCV